MTTSFPTEVARESTDDQVTYLGVVIELWKGKWIIVGASFFFMFISATYAWTAKSWYLAEAVVVRAEKSQLPSLGQLGGGWQHWRVSI